jgi:hypothetical protein
MVVRLITPEQCRGARGMLELSQSDLADIVRHQIKVALEACGVEFLPNGVRLRDK